MEFGQHNLRQQTTAMATSTFKIFRSFSPIKKKKGSIGKPYKFLIYLQIEKKLRQHRIRKNSDKCITDNPFPI